MIAVRVDAQTCFEEWSVLSVLVIETKMRLDIVFGSCCLPGMTVDAPVEHEVSFLFLLPRKEVG